MTPNGMKFSAEQQRRITEYLRLRDHRRRFAARKDSQEDGEA